MGKIKIGGRLKALREEKGISQDKASKELGILKKSISSYENNRNFPPIEVLGKYAKYFNVSMDYLIYGSELVEKYNQSINEYSFYKYIKELENLNDEYKKVVKIVLNGILLESKKEM